MLKKIIGNGLVTPTVLPATALVVTGTLTPDATGNYYDTGEVRLGAAIYKRIVDDAFTIQKTNAMPEIWQLTGDGATWQKAPSAGPTGDYTAGVGAVGTATVATP